MNKLSLQLTIALITIFISGILAQTIEPKIVFETEKHDFGKIKEKGGKVEFKFTFTNMGSEPLIINDVKSSCGCTTPSWSKKPIPSGQKGYISASFNPTNRPGTFNKSITIKSNSKNSPTVLHILGEVIPKPKDIADEYRYSMGPIKMKKINTNFSDIYNTDIRKKYIDIINISDSTIKIGFNEHRRIPSHLKIICSPNIIKPKQTAVITITYDAKKKNDWGYVYDRIYVNFNGKTDYKYKLNVSALIKERVSQEIIDNPPVFTIIGEKTFNFGTLKQGEITEHIFRFKNTGKNNLIIRKTKASCGCTAVQLGDKIIKPGAESSIKAIFNSRGKRGNQHKSITITTNIPDIEGQAKRSQIILMMKGMVEVPPKKEK